MTYGDMTYAEAIWTATALIGLCVNLWAAVDAQADLTILHASGLNGPREVIARGNLREEMMRVMVQLIFMVVGFIALDTPAANPDVPVNRVGVALMFGLTAASALLVAKSVLARTDRRKVIRMLAQNQHERTVSAGLRHGVPLALMIAVVLAGAFWWLAVQL